MFKKGVVLLSGGIDSATTLAFAKRNGYDILALSFYYGQRHKIEIEAAKKIAKSFDVRHIILNLDMRNMRSALTDPSLDVPKKRSISEIGSGIPKTYVPARNTIFLSYALGVCETFQIDTIFIGVNQIDYSGYPDCRKEFIEAFEKMANYALAACVEGKMRIKIETPLIEMKKSQIIKLGKEFGVDFALTISCYDPSEDGTSCGECDACILRKRGFLEAGVEDPTRYRV